jgi:hypothetical protein
MEFQSLGFEFNNVAVTSFEPIFSRVFESINPK